jgi:hypothetical protein
MSVPSSSVKQSKKNAGNRWMYKYVGDSVGCDWFSGKVREPVKLLEHAVYTRAWGEMEKCRSVRHQGKGRKNEEVKEEGGMSWQWGNMNN